MNIRELYIVNAYLKPICVRAEAMIKKDCLPLKIVLKYYVVFPQLF